MDTKSFTSLLRKIIREEVRSAVREEMTTLLNERKTNHKHAMQHGSHLHKIVEKPRHANTFAATPMQPTRQTQFVKDPTLNDLLNETAMSTSDIEQEWPTMNFQSEIAGADGNGSVAVMPSTDFDHMPVNMNNPHVASTVNAMTRDYSSLMKAIDKKKGIK